MKRGKIGGGIKKGGPPGILEEKKIYYVTSEKQPHRVEKEDGV